MKEMKEFFKRLKEAQKVVKEADSKVVDLAVAYEKELVREVNKLLFENLEKEEYQNNVSEIKRGYYLSAIEEFDLTEKEFEKIHDAVQIILTEVGACAFS